jgi:predicted O-methyltransferase YrrM
MRCPTLEEILKTGVVHTEDGTSIPLAAHVKPAFHRLLYETVRELEPSTVIEIGLAYGVSSLIIGQALEDIGGTSEHIIIDRFQNGAYRGVGLANLKRAGLDGRVRFVEEVSEMALPELLREGTRADLVFIDGSHERDHVAVDAFYTHRLLRVGGIAVFDDCPAPGVREAVTNLLKRYRYEEIRREPDFPMLRKMRHRLAAAVGFPRHPRIRYLRKLDEFAPE